MSISFFKRTLASQNALQRKASFNWLFPWLFHRQCCCGFKSISLLFRQKIPSTFVDGMFVSKWCNRQDLNLWPPPSQGGVLIQLNYGCMRYENGAGDRVRTDTPKGWSLSTLAQLCYPRKWYTRYIRMEPRYSMKNTRKVKVFWLFVRDLRGESDISFFRGSVKVLWKAFSVIFYLIHGFVTVFQ